MAVGVVELLEMIDVEQHQAKAAIALRGPGGRLFRVVHQGQIEAAAIADSGQGIGQGFAPHLGQAGLERGDLLA